MLVDTSISDCIMNNLDVSYVIYVQSRLYGCCGFASSLYSIIMLVCVVFTTLLKL